MSSTLGSGKTVFLFLRLNLSRAKAPANLQLRVVNLMFAPAPTAREQRVPNAHATEQLSVLHAESFRALSNLLEENVLSHQNDADVLLALQPLGQLAPKRINTYAQSVIQGSICKRTRAVKHLMP